jgi:hypothetical protein
LFAGSFIDITKAGTVEVPRPIEFPAWNKSDHHYAAITASNLPAAVVDRGLIKVHRGID